MAQGNHPTPSLPDPNTTAPEGYMSVVNRTVVIPGAGATTIALEPVAELPSSLLVKELTSEAKKLVREEIQLAKEELADFKGDAISAGISLGIGATCLFVALLAAAAAAILALSLILPPWAAALVVMAVLAIAGGIATSKALTKAKKLKDTPKTALAILRNDARWLEKLVHHVFAVRSES